MLEPTPAPLSHPMTAFSEPIVQAAGHRFPQLSLCRQETRNRLSLKFRVFVVPMFKAPFLEVLGDFCIGNFAPLDSLDDRIDRLFGVVGLQERTIARRQIRFASFGGHSPLERTLNASEYLIGRF